MPNKETKEKKQIEETAIQEIVNHFFYSKGLTLEKIKDAVSVEKVTKQFYKDIANWYFWAIQNTKFPKDAENEKSGRNIAIIRLITRLIFIWFMRERKITCSEGESMICQNIEVEYLKKVGFDLPKDVTLTKEEWKDLYITLCRFKVRVMLSRGRNPEKK